MILIAKLCDVVLKFKCSKKNLAAEKSGDTGDRLITDQRYNGARCTEARLYHYAPIPMFARCFICG